jgi:hypothetical protein
VLAAGLAMTATVGLAGAGAVSAASSAALHIEAGRHWTIEIDNGACQVLTFAANGTFSADLALDSGTWRGGTSIIPMK